MAERTRILVVDDEEQVRAFLSRVLVERGGYSVEVAESAEEALEKIGRDDRFDMALIDLKLPQMDGLQLIAEIVKSKPQILTILLTGYADIDSAVEAMKRGASDYLTKPIELNDMLVRLGRALEERKRFSSMVHDLHPCSFSWEKIKEMKDTQAEFWAGDGSTRLRIVDISEKDASLFMITQDGKITWPLKRQRLEEIHKKIHQQEVACLAYEIEKCIPTWGNYVSGLLKYFGCDKGSS